MVKTAEKEIKIKSSDILHESIIQFWKVASYGDLNELKKHSVLVREICRKFPEDVHSEHYILLAGAIQGFFESNCEKAEADFVSLLPPNVSWEYKEVEAMTRLFCGGNYRSLGKYDLALTQLLEVPRLVNPMGTYATYALLAYYFLGELHISLGEFKSAENYFLEGLNFGKDNVEESARFRLYSGLGNLFLNTKQYARCEEQFRAAIDAARPGSQLARSWYDMAVYYDIVGEIDQAIEYCTKSFDLRVECNLIDAATTSQILRGTLFMKKGDFEAAVKIFEDALQSTIKFNAIVKTQTVYKHLSDCYEKLGKWQFAYENFRKFEEIKSNIFAEQQTKFFRVKNEEISKQKELVEMFHGELKDSIRYARRIQQAILPTAKHVDELLPDNFLFYKPKDVVSGDFYWIETVQCEKGEGQLILFAVADCTGHGVPGAMVSIVCVNALNRSVREFGLTDPGEVLNKTREIVIQSFEKSDLDLKDGMDISLCAFNPSTREMKWAGANNSLYIIPKDISKYKTEGKEKLFPVKTVAAPQLVEVRPDKMPIGRHSNETAFTTQTLVLSEGDLICLTSDGIADQFGGPEGKKYKFKSLKELLISLKDEDIKAQARLLEDEFFKWKGNYEQVDDVCVWVVRVN